MVLEALQNAIAHQDYRQSARVLLIERDDSLEVENVGEFYEGTPEMYIEGLRTPRRYRNTCLVKAMAMLGMIDTMGYGIHRMYQHQALRSFPLHDYDLGTPGVVKLRIYGEVVDPAYTKLLLQKTDIPLVDVLGLDRIQKNLPVVDAVLKRLRKAGWVEGRKPHLHISAKIAEVTASRSEYIRTRALDDNHYQRLILEYLNQFLPRGKSRLVRENIEGNLTGMSTLAIQASSVRAGSLEQDSAAYLSEEWAQELTEDNRFILDELTREMEQMELEDQWVKASKGYDPESIRQMGSYRNLYAVNPSLFRTPQALVLTRHEPERQFMFRLIETSKYLSGWVKSPDSGFYSLDYEYWKAGKDRGRRAFNPDFFLRIRLADYLLHLPDNPKDQSIQRLRLFQDQGVDDLILVVEIKHDDDDSAMTTAKDQFGKLHFKALNRRLRETNPADIAQEHRDHANQCYTFLILRPEDYNGFFARIQNGLIAFDFKSCDIEESS